jgi:hypothetical protein
MHKQHRTRRWLLGSLLMVIVAWAALHSEPGASAENATAPLPDYGSKEAFKRECERLGGSFGEAGGGTYCLVEGWAWIECDANGNACTLYNSGRPGGGANSPDGTGEQNKSDDGGPGYPGPSGRPGQKLPDTLPNLPAAGG